MSKPKIIVSKLKTPKVLSAVLVRIQLCRNSCQHDFHISNFASNRPMHRKNGWNLVKTDCIICSSNTIAVRHQICGFKDHSRLLRLHIPHSFHKSTSITVTGWQPTQYQRHLSSIHSTLHQYGNMPGAYNRVTMPKPDENCKHLSYTSI